MAGYPKSAWRQILFGILINIPILACSWSVASVLYGCQSFGKQSSNRPSNDKRDSPECKVPQIGPVKVCQNFVTTPRGLLLADGDETLPYGIRVDPTSPSPAEGVYGIFPIPAE